MRTRSAVLVIVAICMLMESGRAAAQATNPPYLSEMPSAERVTREVQGTDARDTAIRQICAFWQLQEIIKSLAGPREFRGLTTDENRLIQAYATGSYQVSQAYEKSLTPDEKRKFENEQNKYRFSRTDPKFGIEGVDLFKRFFSAGFRAQFDQAIGTDAARHQQFVKAQEQEQATAKAQVAAAQGGCEARTPGRADLMSNFTRIRRWSVAGRRPLRTRTRCRRTTIRFW